MPRVPRVGHREKITSRHLAFLRHGFLIVGAVNPFESFHDPEQVMRNSWFLNRDQILREFTTPSHGGTRPWGWWTYEANKRPPFAGWTWFEQISLLLDLRALDEREKLDCESNRMHLSGDPEHVDFAINVTPPKPPLDDAHRWACKRALGEFELAARWHRMRGNREPLVAKFGNLARLFRAALSTTERNHY